MKRKIICITGPTSVGKSKIGIMLAKDKRIWQTRNNMQLGTDAMGKYINSSGSREWNRSVSWENKIVDGQSHFDNHENGFLGEIISADSVQMYKELEIGSNKVSREQRNEVKHHLLDSISLDNVVQYSDASVSLYFDKAMDAIHDIVQRGKVPIIVGGSPYYLQYLLKGHTHNPKSSKAMTDAIKEECDQLGDWDKCLQILEDLDPERARRITRNDYYRLIRGIELARKGILLSSSSKDDGNSHFDLDDSIQYKNGIQSNFENPYDVRAFVLFADRQVLYQNIGRQCEELIEKGLFEEVFHLLFISKLLADQKCSARNAIGYAQVIAFLQNAKYPITINDFLQFLLQFKAKTRNYAKRQYSFYRTEKFYRWIDVTAMITSAQDKSSSVIIETERVVNQILEYFHMDYDTFQKSITSDDNLQIIQNSILREIRNRELPQFVKVLEELHLYQDGGLLKKRVSRINQLLLSRDQLLDPKKVEC